MLTRAGRKNISRREFLKDSASITAGAASLPSLSGPQESLGSHFYVAVNGNDNWGGSLPVPNAARTDGPFRTLAGARDAIRRRKKGGLANRPLTVWVRGGRYVLHEPFVLVPEDSGTKQCPVTYSCYPGEKALFSGGVTVAGWKRGPKSLWTAEVPRINGECIYFRQMFVNGRRRPRARLPKEGYYDTPAPVVTRPRNIPLDSASNDSRNLRGFRFKPGEIRRDWTNLEDVEVVILQFWTEARLFIERIDPITRTVIFTGASFRPLAWSKGYYVENVFEGLSQPGEWYLNRKSGLVSYWPLPGEEINKTEVVVPITEELVRFKGDLDGERFVEHIILRDFHFTHTKWMVPKKGYAYPQAEVASPAFPYWSSPSSTPVQNPQSSQPVPAALALEAARNCKLENNDIAHLGAWGIQLGRGCQQIRVCSNRISDVGGGAIKIGEPVYRERDLEVAGHNVVTDNIIADGCATYLGAPGIWVGQSGFNTIAHNEIRGAWEWAISVGWVWNYMPPTRSRNNFVEYNHIHHLGHSTLGTHGAIYTLGLSPGTCIRHNLIHDISGGGTGIIQDNGSSAILVEYNLVYRTDRAGLGLNFNVLGNVIQNNVFALGKKAQMGRYGDLPNIQPPPPNSNFIYRNIFYWREGVLYSDKKWLNFNVIQDYNLYYDASGRPVKFLEYNFGEWTTKGPFLDQHSVLADPLFVDVENGDFTLDPDSPAFKIGFEQIDIRNVGPRPSAE